MKLGIFALLLAPASFGSDTARHDGFHGHRFAAQVHRK